MKLAAAFKGAGLGGEMAGLEKATYALLACAVIGLVASILVLIRKGHKIGNAVLLLVCGVLPIVFATKAVFGVPMAIAGLVAFSVKYEK
jgi:hypothetical protein